MEFQQFIKGKKRKENLLRCFGNKTGKKAEVQTVTTYTITHGYIQSFIQFTILQRVFCG